MTTPFAQLKTSGLPYGWTTILVGWRGVGTYYRLVSSAEVVSYADDQLNTVSDDTFGIVFELSQSNSNDFDIINSSLENLASAAPEDRKDAERIWQIILLKHILLDLTGDPIDGLTQLSGFWAEFDYPVDSPHTIQGRNNMISPHDYYKEDNFKQTLAKHLQWIDNEAKRMKSKHTSL